MTPTPKNTPLSVKYKFHVAREHHGQKRIREGKSRKPAVSSPGVVPRVSKLMALAIHFDNLLQQSDVRDYADLARLGHVSRARITQIMNLLNLAPDIQEEILFLPKTLSGRDAVSERRVREVAKIMEWSDQIMMWKIQIKSIAAPNK